MDHSAAADHEWDADRYDDTCAFVAEYGRDVVDLLDPSAGERILDLGCGTGHLTAEIATTGATAVGCDHSPEMIERAREAHPELRFAVADARTLAVDESDDGPFDEPFDAVFSNAALHWIPDGEQDAALASVREVLGEGGRFVAELGGRGNVEPIVDALCDACAEVGHDVESPWYFPSVGEYANRLERHGFEVRYASLFDRPTEFDGGEEGLGGWIELFGEGMLGELDAEERDVVVTRVEESLREEWFRDGSWVAPYRRLRFVAVAV